MTDEERELIAIGRAVKELHDAEVDVRREVLTGELAWRVRARPKDNPQGFKINLYGQTLPEVWQKWKNLCGSLPRSK